MGALSDVDIKKALERGLISIESEPSAIGPASIDLRVGKLYRHKQSHVMALPQAVDMAFSQYKATYLEEVLIPDDGLLLHSQYLLGETLERFAKTPALRAKLVTRSSWARLGVNACEADDDVARYNNFSGGIPFAIYTNNGVAILLRKNDRVAQIVLFDDAGSRPFHDNELFEYLSNGHIGIFENGERKNPEELGLDDGLPLTLGGEIKIYRGGMLDPAKPLNIDSFQSVELPEKGLFLPKGAYFIASTKEDVKLGNNVLGWLSRTNPYVRNRSAQYSARYSIDTFPSALEIHANAPLMQPGREGSITLECLTKTDVILYSGIKIGKLQIYPLSTPAENTATRYNGQKGPELSKAHEDYA